MGADADERLTEGLVHLQAAAREAIAAARAFLDVAEGLVDDPAAASAIVDSVGSMVRTAAQRGRQPSAREATDQGDERARVQRIRVS